MPIPEPSPRAPLAARIGSLILTDDYRQRACLKVMLLTAAVYATCIGIMAYGSRLGMFDPREAGLLALCCALASVFFYTIIRSGWNQHLAEPTLVVPQTVVAQSLVAFAYAITGAAHGSTLILLALVMVFGMFNMRTRPVRFVAAYTLVLMTVVMAYKAHSEPLVYPARLEWIHFVLMLAALPAISQLSVDLMAMRARLKAHKREMELAMAHIRELATHDELTGLPNRRHMIELMEEHAQRLARSGPDFFIAMIDLDHFKAVNDNYGHAVGDEALRAFAQQARAILRNTDIIGRWGGEEFLLLLPETPPGEPTVGVERLRCHLATFVACPAEPDLRVQFSAGFARYVAGEAIDLTIERADYALYAAKAAGRNRTVLL